MKHHTEHVEGAHAGIKNSVDEQIHAYDAEKLGQVGFDKDIATAIVGDHAVRIDPAVEKRVVRKLDLILIPWMWMGFGLVFYDKAILGSASLFGMNKDLALAVVDNSTHPPTTDTSRLSWASSIFYFGLIAGIYPLTTLFQRFNMARVLGPAVICWGAICACTAACKTHQGLYINRFFLGFMESIIPSGFSVIISCFYRQEEQTFRQCWWYSATGCWGIIGGLISWGFAHINTARLHSWQILYIVFGCITMVYGCVCFLLPNSPATAWFLTEEERIVAVERLRDRQTGMRCQKLKMSQVWECVRDIKFWLIFVMMSASYTVNGGLTSLGPLIVTTFGFTTFQSILLQFPEAGLCVISILVTGYICNKRKNLALIQVCLFCLPTIAGCLMIWKSTWHHRAVPMTGYSILGLFGPVVTLTIAVGMQNVAGATKKTIMSSSIFVGYCLGNIISPQLLKSQQKARHYPEMYLGITLCYVITFCCGVALYFHLWWENRRRDRLQGDHVDQDEKDRFAFLDLTDKENPYFRYIL